MQPIADLATTKTSHHWRGLPGNFDKLNTRALYASSNPWGIPDLPAATAVPEKLVAYNDRYACSIATAGTAAHFFLDDYRFETVWSKPERPLPRLKKVGVALTPDFSVWADMPLAMQLWQVYRSRWCGAWMIHHGIDTIPTISWSGPESFDFAFAGVATGSVVAVSSVGIRGDEATWAYRKGLDTMVQRLDPEVVLVYGRSLGEDVAYDGDVDFRYYKTRWDS